MNRELFVATAMFGWFVFLVIPLWFRSQWLGGIVAVAYAMIAGAFYGILPTVMTEKYGVAHGDLKLLTLTGLPYFLLAVRLGIRRRMRKGLFSFR